VKFKNKKTGEIIEISKRAKVQRSILRALMKQGTLSTSELEEITGYSSCYSACRKLKEMSLIKSRKRYGTTVWDPVTKQVVTKENWEAVMETKAKARERLRKEYEERGLSEEEIEKKLREVIDPKALDYPFMEWWLDSDWKFIKQKK